MLQKTWKAAEESHRTSKELWSHLLHCLGVAGDGTGNLPGFRMERRGDSTSFDVTWNNGSTQLGWISSIDHGEMTLNFALLNNKGMPERTYDYKVWEDSDGAAHMSCKVWQKVQVSWGGLASSVAHTLNPIDVGNLARDALFL